MVSSDTLPLSVMNAPSERITDSSLAEPNAPSSCTTVPVIPPTEVIISPSTKSSTGVSNSRSLVLAFQSTIVPVKEVSVSPIV